MFSISYLYARDYIPILHYLSAINKIHHLALLDSRPRLNASVIFTAAEHLEGRLYPQIWATPLSSKIYAPPDRHP